MQALRYVLFTVLVCVGCSEPLETKEQKAEKAIRQYWADRAFKANRHDTIYSLKVLSVDSINDQIVTNMKMNYAASTLEYYNKIFDLKAENAKNETNQMTLYGDLGSKTLYEMKLDDAKNAIEGLKSYQDSAGAALKLADSFKRIKADTTRKNYVRVRAFLKATGAAGNVLDTLNYYMDRDWHVVDFRKGIVPDRFLE